MIYIKCLSMTAMAAGLLICAGAGTASATTLSVGGVPQSTSVSLVATLAPGTSLVLKDEFGTTTDTCNAAEIRAATEGSFSAGTLQGKASQLVVAECSDTTKTLAKGSLSFTWTSGTNGTVLSSGAEITFFSTFFGASAVCKTGSGTILGTLTGSKEGQATIDLNAVVSCGILGSSRWTGTFATTSPTGLGVES